MEGRKGGGGGGEGRGGERGEQQLFAPWVYKTGNQREANLRTLSKLTGLLI